MAVDADFRIFSRKKFYVWGPYTKLASIIFQIPVESVHSLSYLYTTTVWVIWQCCESAITKYINNNEKNDEKHEWSCDSQGELGRLSFIDWLLDNYINAYTHILSHCSKVNVSENCSNKVLE